MFQEILKISKNSPEYPQYLKHIHDAPKTLYVRGCVPTDAICIGVVGTRKNTSYGKAVTEKLVSDLVSYNIVIVSGLAFGIDAIAHRATMDAGGKTIAVLGSGVDDESIAPRSHLPLAQHILETGGSIVSEYPPQTPPYKTHFPQRNRIISGLSIATLVIEAPQKSGALITAFAALEQNREVFAVPADIIRPNSYGTNRLLKMGATPVTEVSDILKALGYQDQTKAVSQQYKPENQCEEIILKILSHKAAFADEIIRQSRMEASEINSALSMLEIKGVIKDTGENQYILT